MDQAAWRSITFGNFASGDQPPQLNEQFSREGDNHRRLAYTLCALGPRLVPLSERAILLEHNKPPSELDHSAADPGVACLGEPLLPPLAAALVGRAGKTLTIPSFFSSHFNAVEQPARRSPAGPRPAAQLARLAGRSDVAST